jgi:cytochrome c oxidase assembly protein subunit 15
LLAVILQAKKSAELWPHVKKPLIWVGVLLVAQAILGGIVVKFDLASQALAVHLGLAYTIFGILLWQALRLSRWGEVKRENFRKHQRFGKEAIIASLIQVISGGLVAGTGAGLVMNTWPKVGDHWIPPMSTMWGDWYSPAIANLWQNQILIQFFHRWWAFVVAGLVIHLIIRALKEPISTRGRVALRAVATVLVLQILFGIGNLLMKVPPYMAIIHLAVGLLLFSLLIIITHEMAYAKDS